MNFLIPEWISVECDKIQWADKETSIPRYKLFPSSITQNDAIKINGALQYLQRYKIQVPYLFCIYKDQDGNEYQSFDLDGLFRIKRFMVFI